MSVLEAKNISKKFPGVLALDSVDISFEPGEIHAVIGENGAGKSTLLKALAGLLPYGEGEIRFVPKVQKELSYLPQDLSLYESLTVMENLYFYGKIQGLPKKVIFTRAG